MEIPSPAAGEIMELKVEVGSTVSQGTVIAVLGVAAEEQADTGATAAEPGQAAGEKSVAGDAGGAAQTGSGHEFDVVVLGSTLSCWARARAGTPPPFAPPTSG
jgi:pyruvate/2-oxoglutarate dehydrogenase complex dihydrolipoamide acyltransferase (E2) component